MVRSQDRVVGVTGGGTGIGEALALYAKEEGASHVAVVERMAPQAERVAAAVGGTAFAVDVRDEAALRGAVEETESAHGPIALLCSNACVLGKRWGGGADRADPGAVRDPCDGPRVRGARGAALHDPQRRWLPPQTGSAAGLLAQLGSMAYTITKAAANTMAEWLAITHHHQGVRVSLLCPQAVRTNIVANSGLDLDSDLTARAASSEPADFMDPLEVARMCFDAMAEERFLVLPQPIVASQVQRKASDDIDRWLNGMRRLQDRAYKGLPLPGDALVRY